jgi:predicted GNAT superfamily acetyltransferase
MTTDPSNRRRVASVAEVVTTGTKTEIVETPPVNESAPDTLHRSRALAVQGLAIRDATDHDVPAVVAVLESIWGAEPGYGPITAPALHALLHTGACTRVATANDGRLAGALIAFRSTGERETLHLHVAGVAAPARGSGLGQRLLRDLGHWASDRGFMAIQWTFDPLVARNAHLYLKIIGAQMIEYLVDPYGSIHDSINADQGSDRLLVRWDLGAEPSNTYPDDAPIAVRVGAGECPIVMPAGASPRRWVEIPTDIEAVRRTSPELGRQWRTVTRSELTRPGTTLLGFDRSRGYAVVSRQPACAAGACD